MNPPTMNRSAFQGCARFDLFLAPRRSRDPRGIMIDCEA